jgi:hypothetical protein
MLILDSNTIFVRAEAVRVNEPGPGGALEGKATLPAHIVALVSASAAGIAVDVGKRRTR